MDLFTLAAKLTLDSSSFTSGIQSAESKGNKLTSSLNKMISVAKKLAGAAVIGKVVKSMKNLADNAAAAGDKIDKQSQALGISRKAYQEWDYILSQSGSSIDSLGASMKTLNKAIMSGSDSIDALGLSFDDLKDMDMEDQFNAVVEAFQKMPEGAEKSALAVELLGRNGMALLPLLNSTTESVDELRQRFADLGLEMSDEQIDMAVKYTDTMDNLKRVFDAVKYAIAAEFMPMLQDLAQKGAEYAGKLLKAYKEDGLQGVFNTLNTDLTTLTTNMRDTGNPIFQALADIIDGIKTALGIVVDLFTDFDSTVQNLKNSDSTALFLIGLALEGIKGVLDWVRENADLVASGIGIIIAAMAATKVIGFIASLSPLTLIFAAVAAAALLIKENWGDIQKFFEDLWSAITQAASLAWAVISEWWGNIEKTISDAWEAISGWFDENVWTPISSAFTSMWDAIVEFWNDPLGSIETAWTEVSSWLDTNVWTPISSAFTSLWDAVQEFWNDPLGSIEAAWKTVSTWLDENVWTPITTFFTAMFDGVKAFWDDPAGTIEAAWKSVSEWVEINVTTPIAEFFGNVKQAIQAAIDKVGDIIEEIGNIPRNIIVNVRKIFTGGDGESNTAETVAEGASSAVLSGFGFGSGVSIANKLGEAMDGNHAKGDWNIPYDNYAALLHRNEMVLTASQARRYREGEGGGNADVVSAIQGLRNDLNNLKLVIGEKAFGEAVVDYGGRMLSDYIGSAESDRAYGYGT